MDECKPMSKPRRALLTIGGIVLILYAAFMFSELVSTRESPFFLVKDAPFWMIYAFWIAGIVVLLAGIYLIWFTNNKSADSKKTTEKDIKS